MYFYYNVFEMQYFKNNFKTYKNYVPWIFMYVFFIKMGRFSSMLKATFASKRWKFESTSR